MKTIKALINTSILTLSFATSTQSLSAEILNCGKVHRSLPAINMTINEDVTHGTKTYTMDLRIRASRDSDQTISLDLSEEGDKTVFENLDKNMRLIVDGLVFPMVADQTFNGSFEFIHRGRPSGEPVFCKSVEETPETNEQKLILERAKEEVSEDCREALILELTQKSSPRAIMSNSYSTGCDATRNERFYDLKVERNGCGQLIYSGTRETPEGVYSLEIIDNSKIECRIGIEGRFVAKENTPQFGIQTFKTW